MKQPRAAMRARETRDAFGRLGMQDSKFLTAALRQDADEIDRRMRAPQRRIHRAVVAHIDFHELDLTDAPHRAQEMGRIRPAHRDADPPAIIGERAHDVPPEETGAAEYRDQSVGGDRRHRVRTESDFAARA